MTEEKEGIPCVLYLYIHSKIYENTNGNNLVSLKDAKSFLFQWKIPKPLRILVIKELELLGLIKKHSRFRVEILKPRFNMDNNNYYYEKLGVYKKN